MPAHILILTSDHQLAKNTSKYLQLHGYTVQTYSDPQTAVTSIDKQKPQAIIVDMALASRSGIEFLYELRSYPEWQSLPIIISGSFYPHEIEPFLPAFDQLNISLYLPAPDSSLPKLEQAIRQVALLTA